MKKLLIFAILILVIACSSDDSESDPPQNNVPIGTLIKTEAYFVLTDYRFITTNSFDSNGRLIALNGTQISPEGERSESSITFSYNTNGQIWKSSYENNRIEEFYFTDNLISSSTFLNENNGEKQYFYNDLNQLNRIEYINEDDIIVATKDITFDSNGNIINTYLLNLEDDSFTEYAFEYDNNINPSRTVFNNQEIGKILEYNFNNKTKRIYSRNIGTNVFTLEYTYNEMGYPIASNEYMDGELVTQSTFTYQE